MNTNSPPISCLLPERRTVTDSCQYLRTLLEPARRPLAEFASTHAFISYVLHAFLAHKAAYALLPQENRPEISLDSIVFAQGPDHGGRLVDWDLADDHPSKTYRRTSTRHLMAARLCSERPPSRTVGDDVESFVLLLLWTAARYAPNNMTPYERGSVLAKCEDADGWNKRYMILTGTCTIVDMKLSSSKLKLMLTAVMRKFPWRYQVLDALDEDDASAAEELRGKQAVLEGHEWLVDILSTALQDESWANDTDGARREQIVERPRRDVGIRGDDLLTRFRFVEDVP